MAGFFTGRSIKRLFFLGSPLGGLQRVDRLDFLDFELDMGSAGTFSLEPFGGRLGIEFAVVSTFKFNDLIASEATVDNGFAGTAGIAAPFFGHESAVGSRFDC